MTTFPLATLGVTIGPSGISAPPFSDILSSLQASFQAIYGSDAILTPDSQDGQLLAVFAQAINDCNQRAIDVFNSFSPTASQGTQLSSLVKINGIARAASGASSANVTVTGVAGTTINNGLVGDGTNQWALPPVVIIPGGGSIIVLATCTTQGAITAAPGVLSTILTPTLGWQSVTNAASALVGAPVEADATLRTRQAVSTALPAQSSLDSLIAGVANVIGVQRFAIYENPTGSADANGLPAHSVAVVAEGGDPLVIAKTISMKKPPGTGTFGTTSEVVVDQFGVPVTINFFALSEITITVAITIRALTGYVTSTGTALVAAIAAALQGLPIGRLSYLNRLIGVASTLNGSPLASTYQVSSVVQSRTSNIADTTATAGPYTAGATSLSVANSSDLYLGCPISIVLDNASLLNTTVSTISGLTIGIANAVPASRSILTGANVFMTSDVKIAFNEAAQCVAANVTLTVD